MDQPLDHEMHHLRHRPDVAGAIVATATMAVEALAHAPTQEQAAADLAAVQRWTSAWCETVDAYYRQPGMCCAPRVRGVLQADEVVLHTSAGR